MADSDWLEVKGQKRSIEFRYNPMDCLGTGGFSGVYAAFDARGSALAAKVINLGNREIDLQQAWREIDVLDLLVPQPNDHLVHAVDIALQTDKLIILMPRASQSLADLIKKGPVSADEVKKILTHILLGMESLALGPVFHRDIKPTNILELDGLWCVADFGIARIAAQSTAPHTFQGSGTLEYRAPEIWKGQPEAVAADLYAVGCIGFELVTGQKAFPYTHDVREQHLTHVVELPDGCDPTLRSVLAQLLAKEPTARPRDARQVREQMQRSGSLSPQQQQLQRIRAKIHERDLVASAAAEASELRQDRFRQASVQVVAIWKRFVELVCAVFPETVDDMASGSPKITFRGNVVYLDNPVGNMGFSTGGRPELVFVSEIIVQTKSGHMAYLANLYTIWDSGSPRTHIVRFNPVQEVSPAGARAIEPRSCGISPAMMHRAYAEHGTTFGYTVVDDVPFGPDVLVGYVAEYLEPLL